MQEVYYCFDDANNLGKDCSTNNNVGTPTGGVSSSVGVKGGAANFGGINNPGHIRIPNSSSLKFDRHLTASFFVKLNNGEGMNGNGSITTSGWHTTFAKSHDRSGFHSRLIVDKTSGKANIGFGNNSYVYPTFGINSVQDLNAILQNWVHIAYVFYKDTSLTQMYVNGKLVKEESDELVDFSIANAQDLYLGKYSDSWYPLNGMLDEVRFYNRPLSANKINQLATM